MRSSREALVVAVVLVTTLVGRLYIVHDRGPRFDCQSDDRCYLRAAEILLQTGVLTYNDPDRPTAFIMPAYPFMLSVLMRVFGPGLAAEQATRVVQVGLMTIVFWLTFLIGRRFLSERASMVGTVLAALYPPLWMMPNLILTEALFLPALCLLVLAALRLAERPSHSRAVAFGLAWVAAVYVRPVVALWPGVLIGLAWLERSMPWRRLVQVSLVAGVTFVVCLSPWWVRNYRVTGGFVPLSQSSGSPMWLGTYEYIPSLEDQSKYHEPYKTLAEQSAFDAAWAKRRLIEGFSTDPAYWIRWYTLGKFARYWGDPYYTIPLYRLPMQLVNGLHYALVLLGFLGAWVARRSSAARAVISLIGYMTISHQLFLADPRYAAPLMPFMALFSGLVLTVVADASGPDGRAASP